MSKHNLIVIRADASLQMGTGHIMRCLTLAESLKVNNYAVVFITRSHPGNIIDLIEKKGFTAYSLEGAKLSDNTLSLQDPYASWLGATQEDDANACLPILKSLCPEWLVVDHYGIDYRWEQRLKPYYHRLMVIDDLANRKHCCEVLLDQTCNRDPKDYVSLVSEATNLLVGAQYMLIRPEFVEWRQISLSRRRSSGIKQLLISMGGVDAQNITGKVLHLLKQGFLPPDIKIIVVLGPTSPWLTAVQEEIQRLKNPVEIVVNPKNMAEIMANSDLAIGAAGTSAWERCCLGLPSIIIILAENQRENALALEKAVAAIPIYIEEIYKIKDAFNVAQKQLLYMSKAAASITDGKGTTNVINYLIQRFPQRFSNGSLS